MRAQKQFEKFLCIPHIRKNVCQIKLLTQFSNFFYTSFTKLQLLNTSALMKFEYNLGQQQRLMQIIIEPLFRIERIDNNDQDKNEYSLISSKIFLLNFGLISITISKMYKQGNVNTSKRSKPLNSTRSTKEKQRNPLPPLQSMPPQQDSSYQVYLKFLKMLNARRQKYLKDNLVEYYGKNFPIEYRDHYHFEQGWQYKGGMQQKRKGDYINESSSLLQLAMATFTIIIYSFTLWLTNIDTFYYQTGNSILYYQTYAFSLSISLLHILLRIRNVKNQNQNQNQNNSKVIETIRIHYQLIILIAYFVFKLFGMNSRNNLLIILSILYQQTSKMYQSIRMANFSLQYEYQFKVLDMALSIFVIGHFIAIFLYLTTRLSPENNWTTPLSIDHSDPFALYVYSFYFCSTTIMTVGYGDITPKNAGEVVAVVLVQIFGVIVLGYIINQIGYCVSSLRRGQQTVEKDLAVVEKMRRHYRMDADLAHRVRQYVLNSKPNVHQLSPDEEHAIANKLNEETRVELAAKNMLSVVKSSLFFLCRWSKQFQSAVSLKLTHTLFNPNDVLHQPFGNERIYIIKKGKVDVYAGLITKRMNKVLKTIQTTTPQKEVFDNCYGFTGVISLRKPKMYAVSKGFTSAYYIDRQKFKECLSHQISDIEYQHELKTKVDQARLCESIEINSLQSTKHHYNPTRSLLIKKQSRSNFTQGRQWCLRGPRNDFRGNKQIYDQLLKQQIKSKLVDSCAEVGTELYDNQEMDYVKGNYNEKAKEDQFRLSKEINISVHLDHFFEQSKQYSNYFVRNNQSYVLEVIEKEQPIIGFHPK